MADSTFGESGSDPSQHSDAVLLLLLERAGGVAWMLGVWLGLGVGVVALCQLAWTLYWSRRRDPSSPLDTPPGSMGWLLVGESVNCFCQGAEFFAEKLRTLGPVYKTHFLFRPTVRLVGAAQVREVLFHEHSRVAMAVPASTRLLMGPHSLVCSAGDQHRLLKREVLQAFSDEALDAMLPDVARITRDHLSQWARQGDIVGFHACAELIFQVTLETLVGLRVTAEEREEMRSLIQVLEDNIFTLPVDLPGFGFRKLKKARRTLAARIRAKLEAEDGMVEATTILGILRRQQQEKKEEGSAGDTGTEQRLADVEVLVDMAIEFFFAGNVTSSSTTTSTLLCLGRHPEVLAKVREAVTHLPAQPGLKDLHAVPYLDHVLKEVMRYMVPVGAGFRKALRTLEIGGYQIPKGWTIMHSIRETIQTSELFPNGDQFQPDRWQNLDLHKDGFRGLSYKPFGVGARACAGERFAKLLLKVFILELARGDYSWTVKNPDAPINFIPVTRPVDFLPLHFSAKQQ